MYFIFYVLFSAIEYDQILWSSKVYTGLFLYVVCIKYNKGGNTYKSELVNYVDTDLQNYLLINIL